MKTTGTRTAIENYISKVNSAKGRTVATCEYIRGTNHGTVARVYSNMELVQWMINQNKRIVKTLLLAILYSQ